MKNYIASPLFTPIAVLILWPLLMSLIFVFCHDSLNEVIKEGHFIEQLTYFCYFLLFAAFILFHKPFMKNRSSRIDFAIFVFFGFAALLREMGIQHMLTSHDTTAFKSRFFLNPNNPWSEKIAAGLILLVFLAAVIFVAVKYGRYLINSFFKMNPTTWSIATLCTLGVFCKFIDRFPSNYRRYYGEPLPRALQDTFEIVEETSEVFLPVAAVLILWQYWILQREKSHAFLSGQS